MRWLAGKGSAKQLIANRTTLIANNMHSPEESSCCKKSTYKFLIANEFHSMDSPFRRLATLKKLDHSPSVTKYSTSQFLIDNFRGFISPALEFQPALSNSNRPAPRLEMPVSHRKQTVEAISNRPQFALCNFASLRVPVTGRLSVATGSKSVPKPCYAAPLPLLRRGA